MCKIPDTCSSTMSRNTPEYRTIVKSNAKLTKALMDHIVPICLDLVSNNLITPTQQGKLKNTNKSDPMESAAELVQLLINKVEANTAHYHTLVGILGEDRATYKDVLEFMTLTLAGFSESGSPIPGRAEFMMPLSSYTCNVLCFDHTALFYLMQDIVPLRPNKIEY